MACPLQDRNAELEANDLLPSDLTNVSMEFIQTNPIFRRELLRHDIPSFDAILVLTEQRHCNRAVIEEALRHIGQDVACHPVCSTGC